MVRFLLIGKYIGMVYAMLSIGVLGFIVWSRVVASPLLKQRLKKFAVGLDNLVLWDRILYTGKICIAILNGQETYIFIGV